ncbi:MAG TPA: hypothetical protein V6D10_20095 [Trichocoleus sp.]|jgi:hypothetical protein
MNKKTTINQQESQSFDGVFTSREVMLDFDRWAVAVRQQMLAALKKREGSRSI